MIFLPIALILACISILCFVRYKMLSKSIEEEFVRNPHFQQPNNDGDNISLTTIQGFGKIFSGKFRNAVTGGYDSYVTYHCTLILYLLIIPGKAYRVIPTTEKGDTRPSWHVVGSEISNPKEKACVVYRFYGVMTGILALLFLIFEYLFHF